MGKKNKSKNVFHNKAKLASVAGTNDEEIIAEDSVDKINFELAQEIQLVEKEDRDSHKNADNLQDFEVDHGEDNELDAELSAVLAIRAERSNTSTNNLNPSSSAGTYNKDGLLKCLRIFEIRSLPFIETMVVEEFQLPVINELDDIEREMSFYNHSLIAVEKGRQQLLDLNIPVIRPVDYFCEQVKSDAHMARIKERLIIEEKKMEAFEKRKLREQQQKYNKQIAAQKKADISQSKKREERDVDQYRDTKNDIDKDKVDGTSPNPKKKYAVSSSGSSSAVPLSNRDKKSAGDRNRPEKSMRRQGLDKKYGIGGREKKAAKKNDAKSLNDFSDFNPRGGKLNRRAAPVKRAGAGMGRGRAVPGGKKVVKAKRPGKESRNKHRTGKRN